MSKTMVMSPIVAALVKSEDMLGKDRIWRAINKSQDEFLAKFFSKRNELVAFSENELKSWASLIASELNAILEKEGFNIKLDDFEEGEFGVVSILDILVEWLKEGMKTRVLLDDKEYPAVRLDRVAEINNVPTKLFSAFELAKYPFPIASVATKSRDKVWMTIADNALESLELISRIENLRTLINKHPTKTNFGHLIFPMIDLNQKVDIGWLKGMQTFSETGKNFEVSQALQQTKFKMNQFGARVKSAVAITLRKTTSVMPIKNMVIDKPFYLWVERNGVSYPVMYAYIDTADWKDPGVLKNM